MRNGFARGVVAAELPLVPAKGWGGVCRGLCCLSVSWWLLWSVYLSLSCRNCCAAGSERHWSSLLMKSPGTLWEQLCIQGAEPGWAEWVPRGSSAGQQPAAFILEKRRLRGGLIPPS